MGPAFTLSTRFVDAKASNPYMDGQKFAGNMACDAAQISGTLLVA
jgi:hypothetical protein